MYQTEKHSKSGNSEATDVLDDFLKIAFSESDNRVWNRTQRQAEDKEYVFLDVDH